MAYPDRTVIACMGDGAMQMNGLNVMITISKYWKQWSNPRLIVLVLNNRDLNQVTWEERIQLGAGKTESTQSIPDFPYHKYAELIGLKGIFVDNPDRVGAAWDEALAADRPVILEAYTDPNVPPLPPHITLKEAKNFRQHDPIRTRTRKRAEEQRQGIADKRPSREAMIMRPEVSIDSVRAQAFEIPTDKPEADGTIGWNSTTLVLVEVSGGGEVGSGYTYSSASIVDLIAGKLASTIRGLRRHSIRRRALLSMQRAVRNLGREGLAATAISAVDTAIYDLKARLLGVPLFTLLGSYRDSVPIYGSGGFTSYSNKELQRPAWWMGADEGCAFVKMKVGSQPDADPGRVESCETGHRRSAPFCSWMPMVLTACSRRSNLPN